MSSPVSRGAPMYAQVSGALGMVAIGSYTLLQNLGPCYTAIPTGGAADVTRGLGITFLALYGGTLAFTGRELVVKAHNLFFKTHAHHA